jgi:hypothetical protein
MKEGLEGQKVSGTAKWEYYNIREMVESPLTSTFHYWLTGELPEWCSHLDDKKGGRFH